MGKLGSVAERWHKKNVAPRSDFIRRMNLHSAHRPELSARLALSGLSMLTEYRFSIYAAPQSVHGITSEKARKRPFQAAFSAFPSERKFTEI